MTDTLSRTSRPRIAVLNEKMLAPRSQVSTLPTAGQTGVAGSLVRLVVVLLALAALAALAVFALLPVVLLGTVLLLPALLPLLLILGCLLGDSAEAAAATTPNPDRAVLP
jgi:hypothetical protein